MIQKKKGKDSVVYIFTSTAFIPNERIARVNINKITIKRAINNTSAFAENTQIR